MPLIGKLTGLQTSAAFTARESGSCRSLVNMSVSTPGLVSSRKGFTRKTNGYGGPAFKVMNSRLLNDAVLVHFGAAATGGTGVRHGTGDAASTLLTVIDATTVERPVDRTIRMDMAVAQSAHYLTSDQGVLRAESPLPASSIRYAGMPRGEAPDCYDMVAATHTILVGAPGTAIADGYARAYRVTWSRTGGEGQELSGPPTGRVTIRNAAGTSGYAVATARNAALRIPLPVEFGTSATALTSAYKWSLWGTRTWNAAGGEQGDDECFLIAQGNVDAGALAVGYASTTDSTPDSYLIGSPRLSTNAINYPPGDEGIRQGIVNADDPPPYANRLAYHQDCMWFGDCDFRPFQQCALLSVGASGFRGGDTVTVTGPLGVTVLTGVLGVPLPNQFVVELTLGTVALNIEATARNLVACINRNAYLTGARAYHVSTGISEPGLIFAEAAKFSTFTGGVFSTSRDSAWRYTEISRQPTISRNLLYFSKPGRADAVPPVNVFTVGPQDSVILKLQPYRERLIIFTTTGIYQLTGRTFEDFSVSPFDLTYRLLAPEAVAACDDKVYAWCFEGIIEIDTGSVVVISQPIETRVQEQARTLQEQMKAYAFAVGYRQKHEVRFFYPTGNLANLQQANSWFTFDTRMRSWSSGFFAKNTESGVTGDGRSSGCVRFSDDALCLVNWNSGSTDSWLFVESPTSFSDDYSDGTSGAINRIAAWQFLMPNADGLVHWRATNIIFEPQTARPSTITVTHQSDLASPSNTVTVPSSVTAIRVEPGLSVRRASVLAVGYFDNADGVDVQIAGISQDYFAPTPYGPKL